MESREEEERRWKEKVRLAGFMGLKVESGMEKLEQSLTYSTWIIDYPIIYRENECLPLYNEACVKKIR